MKRSISAAVLSLLTCLSYAAQPQRTISPIDATTKQRIVGKSWTPECPIPFENLRYLITPFWGFDSKEHQGEMIVHKDIATDVIAIFAELFEAKFPIESMRLIDDFFKPGMARGDVDNASMAANNSSAFFYRCIAGTNTTSEHGLGTAIDINPLVNPFVDGDDVSPIQGIRYRDRTQTGVKGFLTPESVCVTTFLKHGWIWAGTWKTAQDYQHFCKVQTDSLHQQKMVVCTPVADVRITPKPVPEGLQGPAMSGDIGPQDTQVYFSECILAEQAPTNPGWMQIKIPGQKTWNKAEQKWDVCSGFVLKSCLQPVTKFPNYTIVLQDLWTTLYTAMDKTSKHVGQLGFGTKLETKKINHDWLAVVIDEKIVGYLDAQSRIYKLSNEVTEPENLLREKIIQHAMLFLDPQTPYVWGGRSPVNKSITTQITGIDCSAFTELAYLGQGLEIPRNAGPQYRASNKLATGKDLQPADLIFFAKDQKGEKIDHVMMYIGDGKMIESYGSSAKSMQEVQEKNIPIDCLGIIISPIKEIIGTDTTKIASGVTMTPTGKFVFLGSYFAPENKAQSLRTAVLVR
ncbi:MAG: NlpC/P60 family protein [Candidatus Babeliales bacterium]